MAQVPALTQEASSTSIKGGSSLPIVSSRRTAEYARVAKSAHIFAARGAEHAAPDLPHLDRELVDRLSPVDLRNLGAMRLTLYQIRAILSIIVCVLIATSISCAKVRQCRHKVSLLPPSGRPFVSLPGGS